MELFNECMILIVTYNITIFLNDALDLDAKYAFGWSFIGAIVLGILINVVYLTYTQVHPS